MLAWMATPAAADFLGATTLITGSDEFVPERADLAREVGVPTWKLRSLAVQARGWSPRGVALGIQAAARADADVKGAAGDRISACERLVISILRARAIR